MKMLNANYILFIWALIVSAIASTAVTHAEESRVVDVTPPAIISVIYNPKTIPEDEFSIVTDDFSFHLSFAKRDLKPYGINFYTLEEDKVFFRFLGKTDSIDLKKEDAIVGYVFISSKGQVLKRFNVLSTDEIVETAEKLLKNDQ
jgi:hypothetical protein